MGHTMSGLLPGFTNFQLPCVDRDDDYESISTDAAPLLLEEPHAGPPLPSSGSDGPTQQHVEPLPNLDLEGAGETSASFLDTVTEQMSLYRALCEANESPDLVEAVKLQLHSTQADLQTMITMVGEDEASLMALLAANEAMNSLLAETSADTAVGSEEAPAAEEHTVVRESNEQPSEMDELSSMLGHDTAQLHRPDVTEQTREHKDRLRGPQYGMLVLVLKEMLRCPVGW